MVQVAEEFIEAMDRRQSTFDAAVQNADSRQTGADWELANAEASCTGGRANFLMKENFRRCEELRIRQCFELL